MATEIRYKRINLDVDVKFKSDGTLIPQKITYKARQYPVTRIVGQRPFIPREVKCKEPIEFTAIIKGREKKLYYEYSTNTWFSIKQYLLANRFENPSARPGYEEASESSNGSEAFSLLDLKRCKVQASAALVDEI